MAITVNGVEISDAMIEYELPRHVEAVNPLQHATTNWCCVSCCCKRPHGWGWRVRMMTSASIRPFRCPFRPRKSAKPIARPGTTRTLRPLPPVNRWRPGIFCSSRWITPAVAAARQGRRHSGRNPGQPGALCRAGARALSLPVARGRRRAGHAGRGQTVPEFDAMIFTLEPGQIAPELVGNPVWPCTLFR